MKSEISSNWIESFIKSGIKSFIGKTTFARKTFPWDKILNDEKYAWLESEKCTSWNDQYQDILRPELY